MPDVPKDTPARDIRRAAVVGAGTMGGGIAMSYANAGIPVLLKEVDDAALQRGLATIRKNYEVTMSKGKMTADQLEKTMALITPTTTYDGFDQVDIVVEAVFENMDLKKSTFAELARVVRPDCVLASNTSTLNIDEFAKSSGRPAQVIGHHFFSPANVMKLLEIVRGRETSKEVIATSVKLGKRIAKVPVVVGNCFGFVANRMLAYYMREAYLLLEEGASVPQIDKVLTDFGMPVGPYGMQDIAGIDVGARIRQYLRSIGQTRAEGPQSAIPDRLFDMGRYGQKTGAGWYKYEAGSRKGIPDPLVDEIAAEEAAKRGVTRRTVSDDEILARITTALANEGARVLEDGYATRAGDIDVIYCYGFGFPRHRGGPMFYADSVGLPTILARVKEYRARFGDYWQPAPLLEKLVAEGRGLYSRRESVCVKGRASMIEIPDFSALRQRLGQEVAVSDWFEIPQDRITQFAETTEDRQWIHVDAARAAAESPYRTTIAHGFLTLSMVSALLRNAIRLPQQRMGINYGLNRVRFMGPVPSGSRIRGRFVPSEMKEIEGGYQVVWTITIEREGSEKPSCVAEWVLRYLR